MADNFGDLMRVFTTRLGDGQVIQAYQGLAAYFRELRSHLENAFPAYQFPGKIYFGYLDMSYFSILTPSLQALQLKAAVVLLYRPLQFEVWLSGRNRDVQRAASLAIQQAGWQEFHLTPDPHRADSILDQLLAADPDFADLESLTNTIEQGTLEFIQAVEGFFANHPF